MPEADGQDDKTLQDDSKPAGDGQPAAGAAPAASESPDAGSSDVQRNEDPYDLIARTLESEEGRIAFNATASLMNRGDGTAAKSAPAPVSNRNGTATATADPNRAELERKADEGDADAALELRKLDRSKTTDEQAQETLRTEGAVKAFADFAQSPAIVALPQADKVRIGTILVQQGPAAALTAALETVIKNGSGAGGEGGGGGDAPKASEAEQKAKADANAAAAASARKGSVDLPGAHGSAGTGPIQMGRPVTDVLNDYFQDKDTA